MYPLVSVVMCTYNGATYLDIQLTSVLQQTYPNIEIVIVDDASTDSTWEILQTYQQAYKHIRLYKNEKNLGYIKNFESALQKATGELIAVCDQDDIWELNKIELLQQGIGEAQLIYHDSALIDEDGVWLSKNISTILGMYEGNAIQALLFANCVSGHAMLFRKALLAYVLPFPPDTYYDWWIALVALSQGNIKYIPQPLVKYRQHTHNVTNITGQTKTNTKPAPKFKQKLRIYNKQKEYKSFLNRLERLSALPYTDSSQKKFMMALYKAFQKKSSSLFSIGLYTTLMPYKHILLFTKKKTTFETVRFICKLAFFRRYDVKISPEETAEIERILNEK
jgi:glycosyltransferase involved in cell wall biosynthesis